MKNLETYFKLAATSTIVEDIVRQPERASARGSDSKTRARCRRRPLLLFVEDDSLVSGVEINTERLLEQLPGRNDVRLSITAAVRPTKVTIDSLGFLGGWF